MSKPSSRGYPLPGPPSPITMSRSARSLTSSTRCHVTRRTSMPSALPWWMWLSMSAASRFVGDRDRREVAREVEVDVLHRHDLRVAAARRAALHAEHRAQRRLAQADHRLLADAGERVAEPDGGGGLALTGGCGRYRRHEDEPALRAVLRASAGTTRDTLALYRPYGSRLSSGMPSEAATSPIGSMCADCAMSMLLRPTSNPPRLARGGHEPLRTRSPIAPPRQPGDGPPAGRDAAPRAPKRRRSPRARRRRSASRFFAPMPLMPSSVGEASPAGARRARAAWRRRRRRTRARPARARPRRAMRAAPRTASPVALGDACRRPTTCAPAPSRRRSARARRGAAATWRLAAQHRGRRLAERERAVLAARDEHAPRRAAAASTPRQSCSDRSAPMPNVASSSWRCWRIALRRAAAQDVDELPGAERLVALALQPHDRRTGASAPAPCRPTSRAASRQVSQLPQGVGRPGRSSRAGSGRRHPTVSHSASIASRCWPRRVLNARSPSPCVDHAALLHDVAEAVGHPGRRRARRRGPRGRSPGSSPRPTSAGRGGRRSARRACRCPCRTRSSRPSPRRRRAGTADLVRARGPGGRAPRGTAARRSPCAREELRGLLDGLAADSA